MTKKSNVRTTEIGTIKRPAKAKKVKPEKVQLDPRPPITLDTLREYQTELQEVFGTNTSVAYANVSNTQLSIARFYGGCKVQGQYFMYNPVDDSLIREDVVKWVANKLRKLQENEVGNH